MEKKSLFGKMFKKKSDDLPKEFKENKNEPRAQKGIAKIKIFLQKLNQGIHCGKTKHDIVKKHSKKRIKTHTALKKGNRLFVVLHEKSCDFCVKSSRGKVVERAYCKNREELDAIENTLSEFHFYEAIIIIDTNDVKFEYFTAPVLNPFNRNFFMKNKLKGAMANFPIKSYFFDCNNSNKTSNYILMGLNINDFIIDIIQFVDDQLDLYIPYFLFSNIELTNVLIDIRKKVDDHKAWDKVNKLLIIRYDERSLRLILTRDNHFLFSRDINYRINGKLDEDCRQLAHEITGLKNYAMRTFNLANDFADYCISIEQEDDYLRQIIENREIFPAVQFFSLQDLNITSDEGHFINNLFIQDTLFRHTVKFQTQKINSANKLVLLHKTAMMLTIICIISFIALLLFNGFKQFHAFVRKGDLTSEFITNEANYKKMMRKLGYDAEEITNIRNMVRIYREKLSKKQCSLLDEILEIGSHDYKNFSIKSLSWSTQNPQNNKINVGIALRKNENEFFRILSTIDAIEKEIESSETISGFELDGLPKQYSLSAIYSDLDLQIMYLKKLCHEN